MRGVKSKGNHGMFIGRSFEGWQNIHSGGHRAWRLRTGSRCMGASIV